MGVKIVSCCDPQDRCGLDTSMLGMPGCAALEEVGSQIPTMGFITLPKPQACSDSPAEAPSDSDADAGT
jgi:hypothetical protein